MSTELPKTYNHKEVEDKIYRLWEESGFFNPDNLPDKEMGKFVATIAPPNITGELHIGHALENTLEDIIIRMKRMQGYKTLWVPGTDHAGIAAQNKVEKQLAKEGLTRHKIGREKFLERMLEWREKYGNIILDQFKKLGLSVDWTRTQFTMNPEYQKAVETAFKKYQEQGWIYQGERVINWCPRCATSISDLEVNHVLEKGKLYFIKYGLFTIATARPETKLGDTALAVHPSDERYKKYIGQDLEIESVDNTIPVDQLAKIKKISIKVVGDISVDKDFGTGIIKVTPAHDLTDYEIAQRHNLLLVKIIDERGKMNENAGIRYQGLKVAQAREQMVKDLAILGLIEKIEDYDHNVGHCDRCDYVIEPLPSKQWFLKMDELAKLAIDAIDNGEVVVHSEKWGQDMRNWLINVRDWNISRQLWWGHKIPIDGEEDVLDTWFSSALWPFAVMGWPEKTKDFKEYYPTNFITSDRGIRYLWQARMIFSGKFFTGSVPFKNIYIHATVLTKDGKRMSKSLGTGIDPLAIIEKYGADALRFGLAYQTTELQDMRFGEDTIIMGKKFANKFWNVTRYVLMKLGSDYEIKGNKPSDSEIIPKMNSMIKSVTKNIEKYKFGEAAHELYDFVWHEFADKYIEETKDKDDQETKDTLSCLLLNCLKLLHPFIPFITEEIYSILPIENKTLLVVETWPVVQK
ncbi:MAG TPA: class I tRNA ligase family protein [Candidatus Paceibacterota bacterium]